MVSLHEGPERRSCPLHRSFVEAAARRAWRRSSISRSFTRVPARRFLHARSHGATEQMLAESGVPFTSIRNGMYADDIPGWFDPDGVLREPGGDARSPSRTGPELARAIAVTLPRRATKDGCTTSRRRRSPSPSSPGSLGGDRQTIATSRPSGRRLGCALARAGRTGWELEAGHSRTRRCGPASSRSVGRFRRLRQRASVGRRDRRPPRGRAAAPDATALDATTRRRRFRGVIPAGDVQPDPEHPARHGVSQLSAPAPRYDSTRRAVADEMHLVHAGRDATHLGRSTGAVERSREQALRARELVRDVRHATGWIARHGGDAADGTVRTPGLRT